MSWWSILESVLDKLIQQYSTSEADPVFWNSMILEDGIDGSGGWRWLNGWILAFFPTHDSYSITEQERWSPEARYVACPDETQAADTGKFSSGLSIADVEWKYHSTTIDLKFVSGFLGVSDTNDVLCAECGWFITCSKDVCYEQPQLPISCHKRKACENDNDDIK